MFLHYFFPATPTSNWPRGRLNRDSLNEIPWENPLSQTSRRLIMILPIIPISIFLLSDSDNFISQEVEVIVVRRVVVEQGLDLERRGGSVGHGKKSTTAQMDAR